MINGPEYFRAAEREMQIENMPADRITKLDSSDLKPGLKRSKRGGRITHTNLKKLSPEETAQRRIRSEAFLKKPVKHVPSEEDDEG